MKTHVPMDPAWFEPGPDGESPFVRKYNASPGTAGEAVSAAFRALISEDEQAAPVELRVGDVVRLERYETWREGVPWINYSDQPRIGKECAITGIAEVGRLLVDDTIWPRSAVTLIRRAGEAAPVDKDAKDAEIARLTAEVERLKSECSDQQRYVLDLESAIARKETRIKVLEVANDSLTQYSSNLTAERDALQARIDARPIDQPDHIADPGKMVDERKGERRVIVPEYITEDGRDYSMDYPSPWRTNRRKSNRRRTAGTIADRKGN